MIVKDTIIDFAEGAWGEDRLCLAGDLFCVLDGATPITRTAYSGYHSSAEWMADRLAAYIAKKAASPLPYPLLCKNFLDTETEILHHFPQMHHLPCLTTAALREDNGLLKCWVLGDCSIYLQMMSGEIRRITDQRAAAYSKKTMRAKQDALRRGEDPTAAVLAQRKQNKMMMNHPGGYWTVGFGGNFAEEFVEYQIEASHVRAALLCTDGLDRLFAHYSGTPGELLTGKMSLPDAVRYLRKKECSDKGTEVKQHDDVAAILLAQL